MFRILTILKNCVCVAGSSLVNESYQPCWRMLDEERSERGRGKEGEWVKRERDGERREENSKEKGERGREGESKKRETEQ